MRDALNDIAAIFLYRSAALAARLLPLPVSYWLAERAGDLSFVLRFGRRRAVYSNLRHAFKDELSQCQIRALSRRVFRNFGKTVVDFLRFASLSRQALRATVGEEAIGRLTGEWRRGKGVIFLTAHLGSWELGGAAVAAAGVPLTVVALDHPTRQVTEFFTRQRTERGVTVLSMREAARGTLAALRAGGCIGLVVDRDFTDRGMPIPLFGEDVRIPTGAIKLAMKTGASFFVVAAVRERGARHRLVLEGPMRLENTGQPKRDLRVNVLRTLKVLERLIRRYPDQWFVFEPLWRP
jgi:KDO2-lipid IV(A) lauroyltransferase